jgi:hypothetical protein
VWCTLVAKIEMVGLSVALILCWNLHQTVSAAGSETYLKTLKQGLVETEQAIKRIHDRWRIDEFPQFLKSAAMPLSSWDILR